MEWFNKTINIMRGLMTIGAPDFLYLYAETINMGPYLKNRVLNKYLSLLIILFEYY
jgi:hypothetical protein